MPSPTGIIAFSPSTPAAPSGRRNVSPQTDSASPFEHFSFNFPNVGTVNARTTTSEQITQADQGRLVTFNNSSAIAVTLQNPTDATFVTYVLVIGAGPATFTPASGNINTGASVQLTAGQSAQIFWDGANWWAILISGGGTSGGGFAPTGSAPFNNMLAPSAITPPVLSSLSWLNQGSASAAYNAGGALYMGMPGPPGNSLAMLYKSAPGSTPWSLTIGLGINASNGLDVYYAAGVAVRESATGKIIMLACGDLSGASNGPEIGLEYYNSPTSFGSHSLGPIQSVLPTPLWLKVTNNGTNLVWGTAIDGQNFKQFARQSLTSFFSTGPNQAGIAINANSTSTSVDAIFLHWSGI